MMWQRQTRIRCFSKSGVKGEVIYIAPCGKKLKNYPEVLRYLQRNNITDIGRENFSFSSRMIVGTFIESINGGEGTDGGCRVLSEEEMSLRLRLLCGVPMMPSLLAPPPPSSSSSSRGGGLSLLAASSPLAALSSGARRGRPRSRPSPDPQEAAALLQQHRRLEQQHGEQRSPVVSLTWQLCAIPLPTKSWTCCRESL
ncbi:hypothetical protein HPB48_023849 [Haemaphysalis longicornis]|uniref:MBD domain-containing protein n=1 Tax=Haemaphysalis longicornis TaxID=44386 RepID=A0A9J6H7U0_HAELO|nr:hypothetical protein HPB48_023849 [Haemaphysalis longicornis]